MRTTGTGAPTGPEGVAALQTRGRMVLAKLGVEAAIGTARLGEEEAPTGPDLLHLACARAQ